MCITVKILLEDLNTRRPGSLGAANVTICHNKEFQIVSRIPTIRLLSNHEALIDVLGAGL